MDLAKKVALVTGGGSGIGRATALALARAGARVVIGNRRVPQGEEVVSAIRQAGGQAVFHRTDVTRSDEVRALVAAAVEHFGRLDLAFNNAGDEGKRVPLADQTEEDAAFLLGVNVHGVFLCMKYEIEQMLKNGGGAIVNNSSVFGLKGFRDASLYSASKHAVSGLTKAAALEYATHGVRINAVAPGPVDTELLRGFGQGDAEQFAAYVPMRRLGRPEEIANAVLWLCSDAASYITGHTLPVDGGFCAQ